MSTISTHVLDTSLGRPAANVRVSLERAHAMESTTAGTATAVTTELGTALTDANGRIPALGDSAIGPGTYRLRFETSDYFSRTQRAVFYPEVVVTVRIESGDEHFHIPLLLSPFGYSTYRGS